MRKKLIFLATFLLTIGIIGSVITAKTYFTEIAQQDTKKVQSDTIQFINLKSGYGSFEILEGSSDEIIIKTYRSNKSQKPKIKVDGKTLYITAFQKYKPDLGISFRNNEYKMYMYLPKKEFKEITVNNNVGSIKVSNIQTQSLVTSSDTGSIVIKNVSASKTKAHSQIGSIKVLGKTKNLVLSSNIGSIKVETDSLQYPATISNSIGSIKILTDKKPDNYMISAHTQIGSTSIFGEDTNLYTNGSNKHTMNLETKTGSIKVEQQ